MYKYLPALRFNYPVTIRIAGLAGVLLITFGFLFTPRNFDVFILDEANQIIIEQIDIPLTQQIDLPPPPARPSVPIESEDEDLEDVTIEETDLESFEAWDAPPPPPEGPRVKFILMMIPRGRSRLFAQNILKLLKKLESRGLLLFRSL